MKYLSLTVLIVTGTVTFATNAVSGKVEEQREILEILEKPPAEAALKLLERHRTLKAKSAPAVPSKAVKPAPTAVSISAVVAEMEKMKRLKLSIRNTLNERLKATDFSEWPGEHIKNYDFNNPQHLKRWARGIVARYQRISFYLFDLNQKDERRHFDSLSHDKQIELIYEFLSQNPADIFNRQLQLLIIEGILTLVNTSDNFREWPKDNIAGFNYKNTNHLKGWAEKIVEQDPEDLFDKKQTTARKVFKSLPEKKKVKLIHKALRVKFLEEAD